MKVRLVIHQKNLSIYCPNGTILSASPINIKRMLLNFRSPGTFKGNDGIWNTDVTDMELAPGTTLAYIDNTNKLVVLDEKVFDGLIQEETEYVSVTEYASMHNKSRPSVKNMCSAGRIHGAYKTSSGWLIPKTAPYPKDKRKKPGTPKADTKN